ncbi:MAG TPA: hypothetical protein ENH56_08515 [Roseobacter sp.]|nr:hypothetical protein [Roseobacter sp.]
MNVVTAGVVVVMMLAVARGYWHLIAIERGSWGYYMVRGVLLVAFAAVMRSGYWDFAQFLFGEKWWAVRTALGGQRFSTVFNIPMIFAAYYFLCSRWVLIPEEERHRWHWWNAWMHPRGLCLRLRAKPFK